MELSKMIDLYGAYKKENDELSSKVKTLNNDLKTTMKNLGKEYASSDNYKITVKDAISESFNETKLLKTIKDNMSDEQFLEICNNYGIIKTKEYVDLDALESAIFANEINPEILTPCKETKTVTRLTIKALN